MPPFRALLVLALCAPLGGCFAEPPSDVRVVPYVASASAAPGREAAFAVYLENTATFRLDADVRFDPVPSGWNVTAETGQVPLPGGGRAVLLVRVVPALDARYGLHRIGLRVGDGAADLHVRVADGDATEARPGIGARVHTVGLWENGTVFYHNWREVRDNDDVPKAELRDPASEPSFDPLRVYVGGRRGERPPEPYNQSGYAPVIQGFDLALRGLREDETTATRIAPEFAYTQPRNEDHPLYGDALVFVILVRSVDALPERDSPLPVCPPVLC